mmetsp:Transcript_826/g.136  ORF Transcript_826/g.136 Transcript_826/m.136 type:complete len:82 (-) Transcript_826:173-418(-)
MDFFLIICMFLVAVSQIFLVYIDPLDGFILFGLSNVFRLAIFAPIISLILGSNNLGLPISIVKSVADVSAFLIGFSAGYIK